MSTAQGIPFEDRVACHEAVERVYWEQRIWPGANPTPKPDLLEVMPRSMFARFDHWWEAERAQFVGRECSRAKADHHYRLRPPSQSTCEDRWRPTASPADAGGLRSRHSAVWTGSEMLVWGGSTSTAPGTRYNPTLGTWTEISTVGAPTVLVGHTAVWTGTEMVVWGGDPNASIGGRYDPLTDSWRVTATDGAPSPRLGHSAVWTGSEMIVWGGYAGGTELATGGRYDPVGDTWTPVSTVDAPLGRRNHAAVWTGERMVVWGGSRDFGYSYLNTGAVYDPLTDDWEPTAVTGAPSQRENHTAVWTGSEMLVWGGTTCIYLHDLAGVPFSQCRPRDSGARYDPVANSWVAISPLSAPSERSSHTAVWTGSEMIVWGGGRPTTSSGGRYDPMQDVWVSTSLTNAPAAREGHVSVWTGTDMVVWGGATYSNGYSAPLDSGGRYAPSTIPTPTPGSS